MKLKLLFATLIAACIFFAGCDENEVPVSGISLNKTTLKLFVGEKETLIATVKPDNADNKNVSWESSNESVATVNSAGEVTAVSEGDAVITVQTYDGGKWAECGVTVEGVGIPVSDISLDKTTLNLFRGEKETLVATILPDDATNKSVIWESSNRSIATVSSTGEVTTIRTGEVVITVTTEDGEKWAECRVTIREKNILEMIPDPGFRDYCIAQMVDWDTDGNGILSPAEAAVVEIIVAISRDIASLEGIEYFTGLTTLECIDNQLTSLDVSKNTALTTLWCGNNQLTSLDMSKNSALTTLECIDNQLTSLDISKNSALTTLYCDSNQLTLLDVSKNTALTELSCSGNQLTSLDVSENTELIVLVCTGNRLTSLDISKNRKLYDFRCINNPGNGTIFIVAAWFDNSSIPTYFTRGNWMYNGARITIDYLKVV